MTTVRDFDPMPDGHVRLDVGEFVPLKSYVEAGEEGSRYVVVGMIFTKDGWEEVRCLTGK